MSASGASAGTETRRDRPPCAFLSDIGVSAGRSVAIAELVQEGADASALRALEDDGFEAYQQSDEDVVQLARSAMAASLAKSSAAPGDVDAVVFGVESLIDAAKGLAGPERTLPQIRYELLAILPDLGMCRALPYGNWLLSCANLGSTLTLAKSLVESGQHRRVMVVLSEKYRIARLMDNEAAVFSDLAVCCTIGFGEAGFRIKHIVSTATPGLARPDAILGGESLGKVLMATVTALKRLEDSFMQKTGRRPKDCKTIVGGHFHARSIGILAQLLEIDLPRFRRDARRRFAHAYAADNLLTLSDIDDGGGLASGDEILLVNAGIWAWSLILLEKV